ncbi:MAG TPA: tetratricopeptide repeat protein [Pyrinomonadaceae bacterium]|nr:tetratricopeptide repeat protein [Pyrinomonadaceae bacterium]
MPDQTNMPDTPCAAHAALRRRALSLAIALAALVVCAPHAHAQKRAKRQSPSTAKPVATQKRIGGGAAKREAKTEGEGKASGEAVVRERRATGAGAAATDELKDEPRVVSEAVADEAGETLREEPAAKNEMAAKDDSTITADADAELAAARAKIDEEKSETERARLQRAYVERLVALNRKAEAVSELRLMLAEERFDPAYFYNAGNALARLGESGAAVEAYRKAIAQRRGNYSRAQHNLGVVLIRQGRWEDAQEALKAALRLENYNYAEASYNLGRLHALRGEAGLAIVEWTRTLRIRPDHTDAAVALARTLAEDGDAEQALSVIDAFVKRFERKGAGVPRAVEVARGEIVAARNLALEAEKGGDDGDAKDSNGETSPARDGELKANYREARTPSTAKLRPLSTDRSTYDVLKRARAARDAGRNEEAVALYNRVVENRGGYFPPANLELGYALGDLRRNEEAVAALLPVARKDGARYPVVFYHLGRCYEYLGQLGLAGENFERAVSLFGDTNPQFMLDLSRVREKEGKRVEALAAMENYVRASERNGSAAPDWAHKRLAQLREKTPGAPAAAAPLK